MPHTFETHVNSPAGTAQIAAACAAVFRGGEILSLEGDLGAGKTYFTRELLAALGHTGHVTSPTFVLQKVYHLDAGRVRRVYHYDVYRIDSYDELADIGFEELPPDSVAVVEWGDKFVDFYPRTHVRIRFDYLRGEERAVHVTCIDEAYGMDFEAAVRDRLSEPPAG
jgi:tRNA threonylcarbamoyladenosine biosynthesis protein TsaE